MEEWTKADWKRKAKKIKKKSTELGMKSDAVREVMNMNDEGRRSRDSLKKKWLDVIKNIFD